MGVGRFEIAGLPVVVAHCWNLPLLRCSIRSQLRRYLMVLALPTDANVSDSAVPVPLPFPEEQTHELFVVPPSGGLEATIAVPVHSH
jgi:hypothetical protein